MVRPSPQEIRDFLLVHSLGIAIVGGTFVFDLLVPLGVAAAVPYALLVLLSLRSPGRGLTWFAGISATILTLLGYALSPPGGEMWKVLTNRVLALFVIWVTTYLCLDHKRKAAKIEEDRLTLAQTEKMASLGELAAGIAHELGTPLAAVQGRVELLAIQTGSTQIDADRVRDVAGIIQELTERMGRIIRGMRTFARDASSDPFRPTSPARVIREVLEFSADHLRKLNIDVRAENLDGGVEILCREAQISQVLVNLIGNATDAIAGLPERWIELDLQKVGDAVQISVTDSGGGIPEDIRHRLMDPFFTTKEAGKGTGLGLSISQGIIESHSGSLWIDADCPNTRFVFSLPQQQRASQNPGAAFAPDRE